MTSLRHRATRSGQALSTKGQSLQSPAQAGSVQPRRALGPAASSARPSSTVSSQTAGTGAQALVISLYGNSDRIATHHPGLRLRRNAARGGVPPPPPSGERCCAPRGEPAEVFFFSL